MVVRVRKHGECGAEIVGGFDPNLGIGIGATNDHRFVTITIGGDEGYAALLDKEELDRVISALEKGRKEIAEVPSFDSLLKAIMGEFGCCDD